MESLLKDLRYGARMLAKDPGFTLIAVVTLALGIAANSTIFSWINSTLLDPIPGISNTSALISVMKGERIESAVPPFSYADYVDLREKNRSFEQLLAYHDAAMALTGNGRPERIWGTMTSANYFDVLGLKPYLGRTFLPEEEKTFGGAAVVVLSHGFWQSHFGGDARIVGSKLEINRHPYTVIGIGPPRFHGVKTGLPSDVFIPLVMDEAIFGWRRYYERETDWLQLLGRLRPGIGRAEAEQEFNVLMQQIARAYPKSHLGPTQVSMDPLWRSPFGANIYLYRSLPLMMALAGMVLLLACANVANLLLVRAVSRRKEIAIRLSMGAGRGQLVRQLLTESLLLALLGGVTAAILTNWTSRTFADFIPPSSAPVTLNGKLDLRVLLLTFAASILSSVIFGVAPALRASEMQPISVLREESSSSSGSLRKTWLASALVVVQIALSFLLLISAGLFIRSVRLAQQVDPGFDADHVLLAFYELAPLGYSQPDGMNFDRQLLLKLQDVPGLDSATLSDWIPLTLTKRTTDMEFEGYVPRLHESMDLRRAVVGPSYFHTMRIPLIAGRDFTFDDNRFGRKVAIVDQEMAERYWRTQDVLGRRIHTWDDWFTVVGVARQSKHHRLNESPDPILYLPILQAYRQDPAVIVRVAGDPLAFAGSVEAVIHELDSRLPVYRVVSLREATQLSTATERVASAFVGAFGLIALLLASVGIYGVVAFTARQRTHEIGIRMALGAQRTDVFRSVLGQGLRLTVMGLLIGLCASLLFTRLLRGMLFGVGETDVVTFLFVLLLLGAVALLACYIPALRATRVDPMQALRCE